MPKKAFEAINMAGNMLRGDLAVKGGGFCVAATPDRMAETTFGQLTGPPRLSTPPARRRFRVNEPST
jgi:hypothetical protein